jgi:trimeric autotransporter adhesin
MSTKTTFKRIALVTVAALGFGVLTTVVPAQAAVATTLNAAVGPNGATSLTVVGGDTNTAGALVRLDVTNDETVTPVGGGLGSGDTIIGSVTAVPTTVLAKTLAANGGSLADTSLTPGLGRSDFVMLESIGQTSGVPATTVAATTTSINTDWTKMVDLRAGTTNLDTATVDAAAGADGVVRAANTGYNNKDGIAQVTTGVSTKSYYVTIKPRAGSDVIDRGAYTFSFQLTNAAGIVISTKTVKIDFVSAAARTDATVTLNPVGTFIANSALTSYDSATADAYVSLTLRNRDGGLIRNHLGEGVMPSARIQMSTSAAPGFVDTMTLTLNDSGTYGSDFGTDVAPIGGGTLQSYDGVYGITGTLPNLATSAVAGSVVSYRWWAGYGNATLLTPALTVFGGTVAGGLTANPALTDVLATAAGMSTADQAVASNIGSTTKNFTVPLTTTSVTLKFTIQNGADTAAAGALITVTPTWNAVNGSAAVTPATSTTGTVYTTDALGNFSVTLTNAAPIDTSMATLVLSGGAAFGTGKNTVTVTWARAKATTISVLDPVAGVTVLTGSTNVTTVRVRDQFGVNMSGQAVSVTEAIAPAPAVASTTVITPIVTDAKGEATYSYTAAATTTKATLTFNTTPTAVTTAAVQVYDYLATLPVVATLTAYHGFTWGSTNSSGTATTLTPATGIYASGATMLTLDDARNISKSLVGTDTSATNDEIVLRFTGLTAAGVSATGASVTITAGTGGWILNSSGLPAKSRTFSVTADGVTANVMATGTGAITFTATSGTVTATAAMWVAGRTDTAGRFITVTSAKTGTANGTGTPVTVAVTDRYGNPVSNVALNVVASGVGSFMGGAITQSFTTDASGTYTFLANTGVSEGGVAKFTATTGNTAAGFSSLAGYVGATEVDATLAAGNSSASTEITFAAGSSATDVAQAATDAAAEATDAANAATDAANAAAEAADAATAAAQDAADAVAALSTQVSEMVNALKKQITALTNLVIKIQKKVRA